ncbi:Carbamoyl phosphate synthetase B [Hibiscus syriacus]|uniref:Carbamoyl phosphate synthetase B n=1 Tax=Hibiscus syriacus TaxID=106335 RepID=A0A6A2YNZ9_HIBSY|nr:Carbamoyl phosphate synthetase B [Hibiscus syriacus]
MDLLSYHRLPLLLQSLQQMMTPLPSKPPPVSCLPAPSGSSCFAPLDAVLSVPKSWSSGAQKSLKEEALDNLKAMASTSIDTKSSTPSAVQALLGSIAAGVIALILYKFTTTIEAALNRQSISDNFSLAINLIMGGATNNENESKGEENVGSSSSVKENVADGIKSTIRREDQSPGLSISILFSIQGWICTIQPQFHPL